MTRMLVACLALLCVTACSSPPPPLPENVSVGPRSLAAPIVAPNNAPPQLKSINFNTLDVCRQGGKGCRNKWTGRFLASTNVASIEVRTNLFSIDVPRTDYGKFAFDVDVIDLPPIFIRSYRLRVIARNSAGVAYEEDMPFRIR